MSDNPLVAVERTLVDWFDANGIQATETDGEWFLEADDLRLSLTELAAAIASPRQPDDHLAAQAKENEDLARPGPDSLLKAKACVALLNSAALLRQAARS